MAAKKKPAQPKTLRETVVDSVEGREEDDPNLDELQRYRDAISTYEREFKKWESRVDKILKRYRDDGRASRDSSQAKFNILWSNVQTLVPATFSRLPQPDVSRRFRDQDPVGRVASLILERSLDFEIQHYRDYRDTMKSDVHDRFLGGRGSAWIRYEPHFKEGEKTETTAQVTENTDESALNEQLDYECAPVDYVHWRDFGHTVARTWEEVTLVWRNVYMNEAAVTERFGKDIAAKIPYDATPEDLKRNMTRTSEYNVKKQARIVELWDKEKGCAVWLSRSMPEPLDKRDDPLGLQEFFPCPKPLYATMTNDTLVPVPDFTLYQDQANELDIYADRIDGLTKMLQLKGCYDGSADSSLARLFTEGNNGTLVPVKNWAGFAEKGGLKGQVDVYDLTPLVQALKVAQEGMEQVKQQVYELTGISDIVRGQTAASETATAQQIKGQYASLRLRDMQQAVAGFATEILQLKAQVICKKFNPRTIAAISAVDQLNEADKQYIGPALALLVGEERMQNPEAESPSPLRSFRIEVAADSLVQLDESQEKQDRTELISSVAGYLEKTAPIMQMAPASGPLILELLKFGVTGFKVGKAIEGAFDQAIDQIKQAAANPPPQQSNPRMQVEQAKLQGVQAKSQADTQKAQIQIRVAQQKAQIEGQKLHMEEQHDQRQMQIDQAAQQQDAQFQQQNMARKEQQANLQHRQKMESAMLPPSRPQ